MPESRTQEKLGEFDERVEQVAVAGDEKRAA